MSGCEAVVHRVDPLFEPRHLRGHDPQHHLGRREVAARGGEIGAEIEQVVLDAGEIAAASSPPSATAAKPSALLASSTAPIASIRATCLGTRDAVDEPGGAVVAGAGVDLVELDHRALPVQRARLSSTTTTTIAAPGT